MIVFDLHCNEGHRFEGWFGSAKDFASQKKRGLLSCPTCGGTTVERGLSAPRINTGAREPKPQLGQLSEKPQRDPLALAQILYSKLLDDIFTKSEDVGAKFPEEARKIYYDESPGRSIRGQASQEEHDALVDEGIPVSRFLIPSSGRLN
ncbi:MAG: DUF1178 family protein [Betaproteobacteria bacterium]|nr:DUF1178 family protein [Betaproteobacteria bacterium]